MRRPSRGDQGGEAVQTCSPSTVDTSPRVVSMSLPAADLIDSTVTTHLQHVAGVDRPGVD